VRLLLINNIRDVVSEFTHYIPKYSNCFFYFFNPKAGSEPVPVYKAVLLWLAKPDLLTVKV